MSYNISLPRADVEQILQAVDKFCLKVESGQARSVETYNELLPIKVKLQATLAKPSFTVGGRYNWKGQPERLIYLGNNLSGNGYWHQFSRVEQPYRVWCEVLTSDLSGLEVTKHE